MVLLLALLVNGQVQFEDLGLLLECFHLGVLGVPQPHIVELDIAHVAHRVGHGVQPGDLALVFRTLVAHRLPTTLANHLLVADTKQTDERELALAQGTLIL